MMTQRVEARVPWYSFEGFAFRGDPNPADRTKAILLRTKFLKDERYPTKTLVLFNLCVVFKVLNYFKGFLWRWEFWDWVCMALDIPKEYVSSIMGTARTYTWARQKSLGASGLAKYREGSPQHTPELADLSQELARLVDNWMPVYGDNYQDKREKAYTVHLNQPRPAEAQYIRETTRMWPIIRDIYLQKLMHIIPAAPSYRQRRIIVDSSDELTTKENQDQDSSSSSSDQVSSPLERQIIHKLKNKCPRSEIADSNAKSDVESDIMYRSEPEANLKARGRPASLREEANTRLTGRQAATARSSFSSDDLPIMSTRRVCSSIAAAANSKDKLPENHSVSTHHQQAEHYARTNMKSGKTPYDESSDDESMMDTLGANTFQDPAGSRKKSLFPQTSAHAKAASSSEDVVMGGTETTTADIGDVNKMNGKTLVGKKTLAQMIEHWQRNRNAELGPVGAPAAPK